MAAASAPGAGAAALARNTDPRTSHAAAERMARSGAITAQRQAVVYLVDLYPDMTAKELAHLSIAHASCACLGADVTERYYALQRRLSECAELEPRDTGSRARVWRMREAT